ncbi:MAG TPA: hypothetical protein VE990_01865 [Acidimicrobiales bacterium]|nr:hypothetical protein [Acidimicrobiales bacterium]
MAPANRHDAVPLPSTPDRLALWRPPQPPTVHLDRGSDSPETEVEPARVGGGTRSPGVADRLRPRSAAPAGGTTNARVDYLRTPACDTERVTAVIELWPGFVHVVITLRPPIREVRVRDRRV